MNQIFYPLTSIKRTSTNQINKVIYYTNTLPEIQVHHQELKQAIYAWLRSLNQEQLDDVLSFTSYFRVHQYLKMFKNDQQIRNEYSQLPFSPFQVDVRQELKTFYQIKSSQRSSQLDSSQKYILDHLYVSDYEWFFDTITLKGDVEQTISAFDTISKGTIFTKSGELESYDKEEYYEINLKKQKQFLSLPEQLVDEFEISVLTKYRQLQDGKIYTQPKKLFDLNNIKFNFAQLNLQQSEKEFKQLYQKENQLSYEINELNLLYSWNQHIKLYSIKYDELYREVDSYFKNPSKLFYLPIKQVLNEYIVFCKYIVSQQLLKTYPLQEQIIEPKKSRKNKKLQENKQLIANQIKQAQELQQVSTIFKSSFKSEILPENEQKLFSKDKQENQKKNQVTKQKEDLKEKQKEIDKERQQKEIQKQIDYECSLIECTSMFMKKVIDEALIGMDSAKKFKKSQQKKAKNQKKQYMSECTSNCTEYQQPQQQQQEIQFGDEEWINNTQTKNQRKKQRKRENLDKKKSKKLPESQQNQETQQKEELSTTIIIEEISQQQEDTTENNLEQIQSITTSTHDDDADFIEVKQKRQSAKKKKITLKKEKEVDQPLKKQISSQQNYLSDDYKVDNTTPQKIKLQRNESDITTSKPGLVKSPNKVQQTFKYDLDKGQLNEIYNHILESKITKDICQIYEQEQEKLNKFRVAREVSIARAQHIIKAHFRQFQVDSKVFGSSITGLALHDSDVDMVVFGIPIFNKQQLCVPMSSLMDVFSQMKWVVSYKHISQATIPLLKITIDPSINFSEFQNNVPIFYILNHRSQDQLNLRYGQHSQLIQIDITFELSSPYQPHMMYGYQQGYHIGLLSTDYQRQISESVKGFTQVAIILKRMLKQKELNDSYTGGVSSFCLAIMIAAIGENVTFGEKLMSFLKRYGQNFDPQKQCISLLSDDTFPLIDEQNDRLPLTIISPINEEKIQIFVHKIQEILQVFRELYLELSANINQIETSLQKKLDQKELLNLYRNNGIEKLVDLVQWQNHNLLDNQF